MMSYQELWENRDRIISNTHKFLKRVKNKKTKFTEQTKRKLNESGDTKDSKKTIGINPDEVKKIQWVMTNKFLPMLKKVGELQKDMEFLDSAKFGDFANGAQIVFDQFISSAEEKWQQRSNVTVLLPHGYDGQGPEHSSARLERFLQLCAQDNMIVCNFTSPANYFHALRRQVKATWRKPLIVMTPKGYLRIFQSDVQELVNGSYQEIIDDASVDAGQVRRVVITTGKIHNELAKKRQEAGRTDVALVRLEQIHPFNGARMAEVLGRYGNASEVVWCQEEPKNMGAWTFVQPHLLDVLAPGQKLSYVGRDAAASPATGSAKKHEIEQAAVINGALG
jgi:2-oxoglutarate dehydrogenase E1 component